MHQNRLVTPNNPDLDIDIVPFKKSQAATIYYLKSSNISQKLRKEKVQGPNATPPNILKLQHSEIFGSAKPFPILSTGQLKEIPTSKIQDRQTTRLTIYATHLIRARKESGVNWQQSSLPIHNPNK